MATTAIKQILKFSMMRGLIIMLVLTFPQQTCGAEAWDWCSSSPMETVPLKGCSMEHRERTAAQKGAQSAPHGSGH